MRLLCANCFNQINITNNNIGLCPSCKASYDLTNKYSLFRIRLEGGFITEKLSIDDIKKLIDENKILLTDYISGLSIEAKQISEDEEELYTYSYGAWVQIKDTALKEYFERKNNYEAKKIINLYKIKKPFQIEASHILAILLIFSLAINFILVILMSKLSDKINYLSSVITSQ